MANIREILYQKGLYDDVINIIDDYRLESKDYWKSKYNIVMSYIKIYAWNCVFNEIAMSKTIKFHLDKCMKGWTKKRMIEHFEQYNFSDKMYIRRKKNEMTRYLAYSVLFNCDNKHNYEVEVFGRTFTRRIRNSIQSYLFLNR